MVVKRLYGEVIRNAAKLRKGEFSEVNVKFSHFVDIGIEVNSYLKEMDKEYGELRVFRCKNHRLQDDLQRDSTHFIDPKQEEDEGEIGEKEVQFINFHKFVGANVYASVEYDDMEWEEVYCWELEYVGLNFIRGRKRGRMKGETSMKVQGKVKKKFQNDKEEKWIQNKHMLFNFHELH